MIRKATANDPLHRRAGRRRGVVIIIALLGVILLTGVVMFVLNVTDQVNRRVETQNAADSTVTAGATWVARTFNAVARNNITISRYIALVNVLDALPQAVRFTRIEQVAIRDALEAQLERGVSNEGPAVLTDEVQRMLEDFLDELNEELDQIIPVDDLLEGFDMEAITHYGGGDGRLWQAMTAMDEVSQAYMESMPGMAQQLARTVGHRSGGERYRGEVFVVPAEPTVPWRRGTFADFRHPVRYGTLPDHVDDPQTNRGPYDTLFGWHGIQWRWVGGYWSPGSADTASGGTGNVGLGLGAGTGSGGSWVGASREVSGYYTWGTQGHLLRRVDSFVDSHLRNTRLDQWVSGLANTKRDYLWPGDSDPNTDDEIDPIITELDTFIEPDWVIGFDEATAIGDADPDRIEETAFIAVEIKSRYPISHPAFMSEGSWSAVEDTQRSRPLRQPRVIRRSGWVDPRRWNPANDPNSNVVKVIDHGWRDLWNGADQPSYTVWFDNDIGIDRVVDANGNRVPQPVYRIDHFYFVGVNVGEVEQVTNPYEGFDAGADDAPAPIDFDHTQVLDTPEARWRYLTFLGAARRSEQPQAMEQQFKANSPFGSQLGLAQAKVFNNHSWDLWTPMWHAQLVPLAADYGRWVEHLDEASSADVEGVDPDDFANLREFVEHSTVLGELTLQH